MYNNNLWYSNEQNQAVMAKNKVSVSEKTCTLKKVLAILGGKWAMPIVYILSKAKGEKLLPSIVALLHWGQEFTV